jgi:hypothetical protein
VTCHFSVAEFARIPAPTEYRVAGKLFSAARRKLITNRPYENEDYHNQHYDHFGDAESVHGQNSGVSQFG